MKMTSKALVLALAQWVAIGTAQAASVSLSPSSQNATVGDTVSFDVTADFSDVATDGGLFRISYDAGLLGGAAFQYAGSLPFDFTWTPSLTPGLIDGIGFGANGFNGSVLLGSLSFTVLAAGNTVVDLGDVPDPFDRFVDSSSWNPIAVQYGDATLTLTASPVPVPAAVWLMASGLSALGLAMRRRPG